MLTSWNSFSARLPHSDTKLFAFIPVASASLNESVSSPQQTAILCLRVPPPHHSLGRKLGHLYSSSHSFASLRDCSPILKIFFFFNYILFSFLVVYGRKVKSGPFTPSPFSLYTFMSFFSLHY